MKFLNVLDLGVVVELMPDDCLAIADALACYGDRPGNQPHLHALQAAFAACAVLAASDTNMDEETPAREWHAKTRRVWGAIDTTSTGHDRLTAPPR
jgi:hypothetical protein